MNCGNCNYPSTSKKCPKCGSTKKKENLTAWQKIKEWAGFCPFDNGRLWTWSMGKYKCNRCTRTYYS